MISKLLHQIRQDGYRARAMRGTALTIVSFGGQNFLRLASNLVLTRLLFPEAFGLMALVQVVLGFVAMFSDIGLRGSIIQNKRGDDPVFLNTAWTLQILRGILLFFAVLALAGPMAEFYDEPMLAELIPVVAISALISSFSSTNTASSSRHLQLGRLTALTLGSQLVGILATIALAWWLKSVWALAWGTLVAPMVMTVLSHIVLKGVTNRPHLEKAAVLDQLHFGKYIFLATIAGFLINQGDKAVLGRFVSAADIGIYNIAFYLAAIPTLLCRALGVQIIFPLYARRPPADSRANRRKINKLRILFTAGLVALSILLALIGDPLVRLLYDPRYAAAGPLLTLLALGLMPGVIVFNYLRLPLAAGHSGRFAFLMIALALIQFTLLIWAASAIGLAGVAVVPALGSCLAYPLIVWSARRYQGWDPLHDALFFGLAILAAGTVIWWRYDLVAPLFASG